MKARIYFRGLTLFTFQRSTALAEGAATAEAAALASAGQPIPRALDDQINLGTLTAWLVTDPMNMRMANPDPLHLHKPFISWIGQGRASAKQWIPKRTTLKVEGYKPPFRNPGVRVDRSFIDYVPRLSALYGSQRAGIRQALLKSPFVSCSIEIPNGRIYAGEFIDWPWRGKTPANVAYMGTAFQGFGAEEVIVEIGDGADDTGTSLLVDGNGLNAVQQATAKPMQKGMRAKKASYALEDKVLPRAGRVADNIEPNTVEVLVTNLTAKRTRPVFWGLHFQSLLKAAEFPDWQAGSQAYNDFVQRSRAFGNALAGSDYADEWARDLDMMRMGMGQNSVLPFPFLTDIDTDRDARPAITDRNGAGVFSRVPPAPGHDPNAAPICPPGRE
jgi:hypothetical protein